MGKVLSDLLTNAYTFLGVPYILLLSGWILLAVAPARIRGKPLPGRLPAVLLLGVGFIHVAIFPQGAAVHEYWFVYLGPGLALAGASLFIGLIRRTRPRFAAGARWLAVLALAALTVYAERHVSASRAKWNTDFFREQGAIIKKRTPPYSVVFLVGRAPPPLQFYADRELLVLLPAELPMLLTHLAGQSRPGYLMLHARKEEAIRRVFKMYYTWMERKGIDTDVPIIDGYALFCLTPKKAEKMRRVHGQDGARDIE